MKKILSVQALPIITVFAIMLLLLTTTGCQTKVNHAPNLTLQGAIITSGNTTTQVNVTAEAIKNYIAQSNRNASAQTFIQRYSGL